LAQWNRRVNFQVAGSGSAIVATAPGSSSSFTGQYRKSKYATTAHKTNRTQSFPSKSGPKFENTKTLKSVWEIAAGTTDPERKVNQLKTKPNARQVNTREASLNATPTSEAPEYESEKKWNAAHTIATKNIPR
jgi:hypothetical protein